MKVFVAGSGGAFERILVSQLIENGYQVTALARDAQTTEALCALGAQVAEADVLDTEQLTQAIVSAAPNIIIDQVTDLSSIASLAAHTEDSSLQKRLRAEVLETMLAAGRLAGVRRFIAQSFCGWPLTLSTAPLGKEEDPLHPDPPVKLRGSLKSIRDREEALQNATDLQTLILRYGFFYGPGTALARDGSLAALIRDRKLPLVRNASASWSFIHIADAARATVVAVSQGAPGIYNVVDSEPAPISDWLPLLAEALGAPPPRTLPAWLARFVIGEAGVSMMLESQGASNRKAISGLGWQPMFANYRQGFLKGL